jgi:hypothetical protein
MIEEQDFCDTYTDIEFIKMFAKCGINHNHSHNEDKLEKYLRRMHDKLDRLASLESQLKDKDRIIAEYHSLIIPLHEWAHNNTAFKLGESITKRILEMAKSSVDKDKEIERLNHVIIDIKNSYLAMMPSGKSDHQEWSMASKNFVAYLIEHIKL